MRKSKIAHNLSAENHTLYFGILPSITFFHTMHILKISLTCEHSMYITWCYANLKTNKLYLN